MESSLYVLMYIVISQSPTSRQFFPVKKKGFFWCKMDPPEKHQGLRRPAEEENCGS